MTYIVLARKYRPKRFAEMVGQGHVVQALSNALQTQRLHHAYLFTGTRGVGKTTVSRILAKSLNCVGADGLGDITHEPCGVCEACRQIDAGRFVDYTELDAASNRGVEEVQSLLEQAVYKPVQGRFKVFMIDEVHMLTTTAFNAMLKTLEEPPAYVKFVLATTDPQKVPITVLSRCLQFNLRPMAAETVSAHLAQVLSDEQVPFEMPALQQLGLAARGSMRDALSLTDQAIAFGNGQVHLSTVQGMLGSVDRQHVWRLIHAVAERDGEALVAGVQTLRDLGLGAAQTLDELVHVLQRMAVSQWTQGAANDDAELQAAAQALAPDDTQLLYSLCLSGRQELGWAPDEYAALTMVLLRALTFVAPSEKKSLHSSPELRPLVATPQPAKPQALEQVLADLALEVESALEAEVETATQQMAAPAPVQAPSDTSDPLDGAAHDRWLEAAQRLCDAQTVQALVRELVIQSDALAWAHGQLSLQVASSTLAGANVVGRLQQVLQDAGLAQTLHVKVGPVRQPLAQRWADAAQARQRQTLVDAQADPYVAAMMNAFGGKILPHTVVA